jgi:2-methylcitrate dehydratase PrpD
MNDATRSESATLSGFLASLDYAHIPAPVVARCEELFLDWIACALAGRGAPPIDAFEAYAAAMGPAGGPAELLTNRRRSSPLFAALVNGGASHVVEQDDLHNSSVLHPATVVFPAALATAQASGAGGREFIAACVAGYECGIRVGEFLGRSHYKVFHTTGTAGTLAAAAAAGRLLRLDAERMQHCLGSAGTQAAGLWEFLRDAADSKQLHTGKAAANGLTAAWLARAGFTGARRILEGPTGMAAGMSSDADPARLVDGLGTRWALAETSFKFHASCRHTHPAADALLELMRAHALRAADLERILCHVHQGAIDVLGPVTDPRTVHQAKFSMGFVLAQIALTGRAGLGEFTESALADAAARDLAGRVDMVLDPDIDRAYPKRWIGRVVVTTRDGRTLEAHVETPKGDPGNTLTRSELEDKALRLARWAGGASEAEMRAIIARCWRLRDEAHLRDWLA